MEKEKKNATYHLARKITELKEKNLIEKSVKSHNGKPCMNDRSIAMIETMWMQGATDPVAAQGAGMSLSTLNNYVANHPEFRDRRIYLKQLSKEVPKFKAKKVVEEALNNGDTKTAQWVLEKTDRDYQPTINVNKQVTVLSLSELAKDVTDKDLLDVVDVSEIEEVEEVEDNQTNNE